MQNIIDAGACQFHGIQIEDVGLAKIDLSQNFCEVLPLAG